MRPGLHSVPQLDGRLWPAPRVVSTLREYLDALDDQVNDGLPSWDADSRTVVRPVISKASSLGVV